MLSRASLYRLWSLSLSCLVILFLSQACGGTNPDAMTLQVTFPSGETYPKNTHKLVLQLQTARVGSASGEPKSSSTDIKFSLVSAKNLLQLDITGKTLVSIQQAGELLLLPPEKNNGELTYDGVFAWLEDKAGKKLAQGELKKLLKPGVLQELRLKLCSKQNPCEDLNKREFCDGKDNNGNGWIDEDDACPALGTQQTISDFILTSNAKTLLTIEEGSARLYKSVLLEGFTIDNGFSLSGVGSEPLLTAASNFILLLAGGKSHTLTENSGKWSAKTKELSRSASLIATKKLVFAGGSTDKILVHGEVKGVHQVYTWKENDRGRDKGVMFTPTTMLPAKTSALTLATDNDENSFSLYPSAGSLTLRFHSHGGSTATKTNECSLEDQHQLSEVMKNPLQIRSVASKGVFGVLNRKENKVRLARLNQCNWISEWNNKLDNTIPSDARLQDIAMLPRQESGVWLLVLFTHESAIHLYAFEFGDSDTLNFRKTSFSSKYTGTIRLQAAVENKDMGLILVQTNSSRLSLLRIPLIP